VFGVAASAVVVVVFRLLFGGVPIGTGGNYHDFVHTPQEIIHGFAFVGKLQFDSQETCLHRKGIQERGYGYHLADEIRKGVHSDWDCRPFWCTIASYCMMHVSTL
jgi:hypothetical protein